MGRTKRFFLSVVAFAATMGCAERYAVDSRDLMRGTVIENARVRTADGYDYAFHKGYVKGDVFVGTLVEEVEVIGENDDIYVTDELRQVELPISSILEVTSSKRTLSTNALYVAGAVSAGAIIFAALSDDGVSDSNQRGSGPVIKPVP